MIKSSKYVHKTKKVGKVGNRYEGGCVLEVRYRFSKEVAPKDRGMVSERMSLRGIDGYLAKKEKMFRNTNGSVFTRRRDEVRSIGEIKLTARRTWFGLGLNVRVSHSEEGVPRDELFDIEAFNDYALTGEVESSEDGVRAGVA